MIIGLEYKNWGFMYKNFWDIRYEVILGGIWVLVFFFKKEGIKVYND